MLSSQPTVKSLLSSLAFWAGPLGFAIAWLTFHPADWPADIPVEMARGALATTIWVAIWWVTEAIPVPATSLLPLVLLPLSGGLPLPQASSAYAGPITFLFLGGFVLALGLEKWAVHRRIALHIIRGVGSQPQRLVLGFMLATGLLSMWISNTATTLMMVPIALAIVEQLSSLSAEIPTDKLAKRLLLGIAYSASIGGMATLVGTPTNRRFSGFVEEVYGLEIPFAEWMAFGLPISTLLLTAGAWVLTRGFQNTRAGQVVIARTIDMELEKLGPIRPAERRILLVFGLTALAWIIRGYILTRFLPGLHDSMIALTGMLVLFLVRDPESQHPLMDWDTAVKLPWGILLLFGGAFAVARGIDQSGLATWLAQQLGILQGWPVWVAIGFIVLFVNFLTEITMNMATCTMMMPVLAALGPALGIHPLPLMAATSVAASCAFMLPVATAPNAIVFGAGRLRMKDMAQAGFQLNLMAILIITLLAYFWLPWAWELELREIPAIFFP